MSNAREQAWLATQDKWRKLKNLEEREDTARALVRQARHEYEQAVRELGIYFVKDFNSCAESR